MSRIALVSEHASPLAVIGGPDAGGQNVYVARLAAALVDLGHSVTVYTRRDDRATPTEVRTAEGVLVRHLDAGPPRPIDKDDLAPFVPALGDSLGDWFAVDRPDIVHSHFWMSGVASVAAAAGTPVVHTFHALGSVRRRHQGMADHSPVERSTAERSLLRSVDRIVATCSDEVAELVALGADPARVSVVPCGYDDAVFCANGARLERGDRRRVVCVSRLVPRKGLADVVRALALLDDVELVVAGGAPAPDHLREPHAAELVDLAERLGVADRLVLLGGLDPCEVAVLDRSADVFVSVPWYEPFGIAPVEAMACGVPVVASRVGGMLDTVVDGGTGALVPPRDPAALAAAVRSFLDDPVRSRQCGDRAAWRARRRYAWPVVARSMDRLYTEVCQSASRLPVHRTVPS